MRSYTSIGTKQDFKFVFCNMTKKFALGRPNGYRVEFVRLAILKTSDITSVCNCSQFVLQVNIKGTLYYYKLVGIPIAKSPC